MNYYLETDYFDEYYKLIMQKIKPKKRDWEKQKQMKLRRY